MSIIYHRNWLRSSAYKLKKYENGWHISPKDFGETYNPFDCATDILLVFLNIGHLAHKDADATAAITDFVNSYGILGFAQSVIAKEYEDGTVKVYENNFATSKPALTASEYFKLFLPDAEARKKYFKREHANMTVTMRMSGTKRSAEWLCMADSDYAENSQWISNFAEHLYALLGKVQRGETFEYKLGNIRTSVVSDGGTPRVEYEFDSLKSALDIMFMLEITSPRRTLKLCKHCGGVFRSERLKTEYCSASCRNVHNVKLSRRRRNT
jgi:hypothetical protein